MDFDKEILKILEKETKVKDLKLEIPKDPTLGDYAFPCFLLAKALKKNPVEIAQDLAKKIKLNGIINKVEVKGPYLNFFIKKKELVSDVIKEIVSKDDYGSLGVGKGKKMLVEHTSINPNASPHVGRARNALIGDSIVRMLRFQGYKVEVHYFVNDIGKQIAMLVYGSKGKVTFDKLLKLYVDINNKIKEDPSLEKKVFEILNKLENNDKKIKDEFRKIVDICIKGQSKIFGELGIKYDKYDYESKYLFDKSTSAILKKFDKLGKLFKDEDGRMVLDQEGFDLAMKSPVLVLTRGDGTSLYPLRDIAYHMDVKKGESIILLGEDHKLYAQQIKVALDMLEAKVPRSVHYSFILLQEGKMSTRKGTVVLLEDFMKEAMDKAKKEISKRYDHIDEDNARKIAYGAIKYAILKISNEKNVIFNWDTALNFEGDSGPYLQYAYARICSILRKADVKIDSKIDYNLLDKDEEIELVKKLGMFPKVVLTASTELKPNLIANYVFELSSLFSNFYNSCPVLKAGPETKKARLVLIECVKKVIKNGLQLLGIDVLEKM